MSEKPSAIADLRARYHRRIFADVLRMDAKGIPNNADSSSALSVRLAQGIAGRVNLPTQSGRLSGQSAGKAFEEATAEFIKAGFTRLAERLHLHGLNQRFSKTGPSAIVDS